MVNASPKDLRCPSHRTNGNREIAFEKTSYRTNVKRDEYFANFDTIVKSAVMVHKYLSCEYC